MSFRAVETLKVVDIIACEDTRHSLKLLNHYGVAGKLVSYHEHNERERAAELVERLKEGGSVAVVSDAGTPGINDPGFVLVRAAVEAGVPVVPVPGPAAFVSAAVVSGLPTDSIFFGGFLPSRKSERRRRLEAVRAVPATLVFYESPHRVAASLRDCLEVLGDRSAAVARELTKVHENVSRGRLSELLPDIERAIVKGEIVIVIDRAGGEDMRRSSGSSLADRVKELEAGGMDRKGALKAAAKEFGLSRSEAYRQLQGA
jgi:16S rRNA (cytidine1402-2'-O)-methyltransferase